MEKTIIVGYFDQEFNGATSAWLKNGSSALWTFFKTQRSCWAILMQVRFVHEIFWDCVRAIAVLLKVKHTAIQTATRWLIDALFAPKRLRSQTDLAKLVRKLTQHFSKCCLEPFVLTSSTHRVRCIKLSHARAQGTLGVRRFRWYVDLNLPVAQRNHKQFLS